MRHPALQQTSCIAPDVFPPVFDWFFAENVFKRWRDAKVSWQLHCIGTPGAGKTTLTSLVHRHLKEHFQKFQFPIVPIYIDKDVLDHENHFIEDFLALLYLKLETTALDNDPSKSVYQDYIANRHLYREGFRTKKRLNLLRKALELRLQALQNARAFLLLDGLDRCSQIIRMTLEEELSKLLKLGLSILITSRFPDLDQDEYGCDHVDHGVQPTDGSPPLDYKYRLDMFLECDICEYLLCFPCKSQNRHCGDGHEDSHMVEPYDHLNVNVQIPPEALKDFIAWNLELEHGDLGLGSSARKPPRSNLGNSLISNAASKSAQWHADEVYLRAQGHIGVAKARLDLIHNMTSLEGVEMKRDQIPANIVTMFDAALKELENQPAGKGGLGVKAIAAASFVYQGESIPSFREALHKMKAPETRSGEDIIEATRGFLLADQSEPRRLAAFHPNFFTYTEERYNPAIYRARKEAKQHRARFEPPNNSESSTEMSSNKPPPSNPLKRFSEEPPAQPFIVRKGTLAWH